MSYEKARAHLEKFNLSDKIRLFEASSATVALAAAALGTEEERIAKSLSFSLGDSVILVITAGDAKIDNSKYKSTFGTKAKMLDVNSVEEKIGHAVGGVCPFGINEGIKVYLDESLRRFDVVYPAAGTSHSAVELTISELEIASQYTAWVDVTKLPENE